MNMHSQDATETPVGFPIVPQQNTSTQTLHQQYENGGTVKSVPGPLSTARQIAGRGLTAEIVYASKDGKSDHTPVNVMSGLSSREMTKSAKLNANYEEQPCVLQGFNGDAVQPQLRYGDAITLLPDGFNAIISYGGDEDGRAWMEVLRRDTAIPPNMRDCQWYSSLHEAAVLLVCCRFAILTCFWSVSPSFLLGMSHSQACPTAQTVCRGKETDKAVEDE